MQVWFNPKLGTQINLDKNDNNMKTYETCQELLRHVYAEGKVFFKVSSLKIIFLRANTYICDAQQKNGFPMTLIIVL